MHETLRFALIGGALLLPLPAGAQQPKTVTLPVDLAGRVMGYVTQGGTHREGAGLAAEMTAAYDAQQRAAATPEPVKP